ncbi:MAG: molybdopterin molybdotransferase MoeA, partial [Coriobacteriia bacterium]|nr:molybdopterin molybdotransferase MoeA [Coriobacteriia bacterium]
MARVEHGVEDSKYYTPQEAVDLILNAWKPYVKSEMLPTTDAIDRVLARDYHARFTNPLGQTSSVDGIAVRFDDFKHGMPDTKTWKINKDFCLADTGDDVPDEFDTVIKLENLDFEDNHVEHFNGSSPFKDNKDAKFSIFRAPERRGEHLNSQGSNFKEGELLVASGKKVTPERMSCLIAGGVTQVEVYALPQVAVIPTGNELVPSGVTPKRGETIESNSALISAFIKQHKGQPRVYPLVRDITKNLEDMLKEAAASNDLVILNAGTSKGSEDYAPVALEKLGDIKFHWVNHGPGRPVMGGMIDNTPILVIPGPPISCDTVLHWFLHRVLSYFSPASNTLTLCVNARLTKEIKGSSSMVFWQRVKLDRMESSEGDFWATPLSRRTPEALGQADGIVIVP